MSRPLLLRLVIALLGGAATGLAFEPVAWPLLLPLGVAALTWAAHGLTARYAALVGLLYGATFMAVLLPWLQVIGVDAWIGLSLLEGAFFALLGVALAVVARLPVWPVWAAACWVAVELARSVFPWGGFPWGRLAFATIDTPLSSAMTWVGASGTTFIVALLGSTVAWAVLAPASPRPAVRRVAGSVAVLALAAAPALATLVVPVEDHTQVVGEVRVAAVQGNVPGEGMDAFAERRAVLDNHVAATLDLGARIAAGRTVPPDLVLWPENSTDIDPYADPSVYADIQRAVDAVGVPVLVGAMVAGEQPMDVLNQGIVWEPGTGPSDSYSKTHPVPFGEYIPMRAQLAKLFERLDQIPRDMVPGTEPGLLEFGGAVIGDVICFEVAYDDVVRDVTALGAELLVVQTNNATYMGTGQVEQQFAIARLRALETGRHVVVIATNGISGIVAPDGSVTERAAPRKTVVLEADLPLLEGATPATSLGRWIDLALLAIAGAAVVVGVSARHRRKGNDTGGTPMPASQPAGAGPGRILTAPSDATGAAT